MTLTKETLPEELDRFLSYLNKFSDKEVTQLLTHIDNNETLIQADFQRWNAARPLAYGPCRTYAIACSSLLRPSSVDGRHVIETRIGS